MGGTDRDSERYPVRLRLEARPENAAVARRAIADEAVRAGLGGSAATAAQVIVTEGFTNAVKHAYPGEDDGTIEIRASGDGGGMTVIVADGGAGFRPHPPDGERWGGLGLELMVSVAETIEMGRSELGGTEVRARIEAARAFTPG